MWTFPFLQTAKLPSRLDGWMIARSLRHPSTLLLLGSNAIPLFGVTIWHWDAFLLLMLYWMETAIIAFWTIVRIACMPTWPVTFAAFFAVHSGMFMTVHFIFLWGIFSGTWSRHIHGVAEFLDQIVIRSGLLVPLAALFFSRGGTFVYHVIKPHLLARRRPTAGMPDQPATGSNEYAELISGLYGRVIVMQVVIIFGASLSILIGTLAPLIILVLLKTATDLGIHLSVEFRARPGHAAVPRVPATPRADAMS